MTEIIVGVDGSQGAADALAWAVEEGRLRRWRVTAVMAWSYLDQHHTVAGAPFDPRYEEKDARAALDAFVARALGSETATDVARRVVCDLPSRALLGATGPETRLLVVGARGLGGFRALLLGSVSQQVLDHSTCAVAVVRRRPPSATGEQGRVVVGIDGSEDSRRALRWALDEARCRKASLEVVHAWLPPSVGLTPLGGPTWDLGPMEEAARHLLDSFIEAEDTTDLVTPVDARLVRDTPAAALLSAAADADLLVVGARGLSGLGRAVLGSVSHRIAHQATGPLVIVPPDV